MRCCFEDHDATEAERAVVDAWLATTECIDVMDVTVEELAVLVHGTRNHANAVTGTALRHGDLAGELMAALASMRS
jgi:hypothetical protein